MRLWHPGTRKIISGFFLTGGFLFSFTLFFWLLKRPVLADDSGSEGGAPAAVTVSETSSAAAEGVSNPAVDPAAPAKAATKVIEKTRKQMIVPMLKAAFITIIINVTQFVLDRLAYDAAVWVASGGKGETPLFHADGAQNAWEKFGLDVAGEAFGSFSQSLNGYLDGNFNLCAPTTPQIRLGLQLGVKGVYQPPKPKCDWESIQNNWSGFVQGVVDKSENFDPNAYVLNTVAKGLQPGQNALSYSIATNIKIHGKVLEKKQNLFAEYLKSGGFKNVTDVVTGAVKTPSSLVQNQLQTQLTETQQKGREFSFTAAISNAELWQTVGLHTLSVFFNTLLSQGLQKLYNGLLPSQDIEFDPFNEQSANIRGREAAAEEFAGLISTIPSVIDQYNVLTEFVVCPTAPAVRQINNCVLDASFAEAIVRSDTSESLTVAQAMENGLLHGSWPLYRSDDLTHNQDLFCHTYGYCYGNLVKLRKARILPVGWELAAESPQNKSSNPVTLEQVVAGFEECDSDGKLSADHPWCHLIDPNWVLKYPKTQCLASVVGEQLVSTLSIGRSGTCVDTPSCVSENEDGICSGYGYCVREKNTWRFDGDECPEQFASCLAFTNAETSETGAWLLSTLDFGVCSQGNAGCLWYRTQKHLNDGGTPDDKSDDTYEWLPEDDIFVTSDRENDVLTFDVAGNRTNRTTYSYDTDENGIDDLSYETYTFEDRMYLNNQIQECSESEAGCTELYPIREGLSLNILRNPSFEDDEDKNHLADSWEIFGTKDVHYSYDEEGSNAFHGTDAYKFDGGTASQLAIPLQQNQFYTLSFYAKGVTSAASATAALKFVASDNTAIDFTGYTTNCTVAGDTVSLQASEIDTEDFESFDCAFTTPILNDSRLGIVATLTFKNTADVYVDAIQLEIGENASNFHDRYSENNPDVVYNRVAPSWLGCTGNATDPKECEDYATFCSATEIGCSLYTPKDGDPNVPAVLTQTDQCPDECVGYAAFKQEATSYDAEEFPVYLISDTAVACSEQEVGCDEFTNLETEETQAYSTLRACVTPDMISSENNAVFFTWQGSDLTGYQLVSYQLLRSDLTGGDISYTQDTDEDGTFDTKDSGYTETIFNDTTPEVAPCTNWDVTSESKLSCVDDVIVLAADDGCNEHADIFTEPDCREFYDELGNIHYRRYSETISVREECTAFRKTDANQTDCDASGGYWTAGGECRYFAWPAESTSCSETAVGCRSYTGGAGRNSTTVYEDLFENGQLVAYETASGTTISLSNESVATDGHSMRVVMGSSSSLSTFQIYLNTSDKTMTYNKDDSGTCGDTNGDGVSDKSDRNISNNGCAIDADGDGTFDCTIADGDNSCGALDDQLVQGKSYILSFWAKGTGSIKTDFVTQSGTGTVYDLVDPNDGEGDSDSLSLDGSWQLYELGPLDTTDMTDFDDTAILRWSAGVGTTFYLDNIVLKAVEENVTLIKDSWVTPSICDKTPAGADTPQYYLGCEAYTDQNGDTVSVYQFNNLCSESAVGCASFYQTQNSTSPYTQVFNGTCYISVDKDGDGIFSFQALNLEEDIVSQATDCELEGETVCTILSGSNQCQFTLDRELPIPYPMNIVLGPETVVVPADKVVYLIEDDETTCTESNAGCTEVGIPTFSQDHTAVESLVSTYILNLPDTYADILCSNEALFCAEWASTENGNYYFKNPGDQACEYKTGVSLNGVSYSGWFRTGTTQFCYGTGSCSGNSSLSCTNDADCIKTDAGTCNVTTGSYIQGGDYSGIWFNGDTRYEGWTGECESQYDLCTEFVDPVDTSEGERDSGTSYFFLDNSSLNEETLAASERCKGQVSLTSGCALFDDLVDQELTYSASPSYLVSEHADLFFGESPRSLQNPISCPENGTFTLTTGIKVDVCANRCAYEVNTDEELENVAAIEGPSDQITTIFFGQACLTNLDCPMAEDSLGNEVEGSCFNLKTDQNGDGVIDTTFDADANGSLDASYDANGDGVVDYLFVNDTNRMLKVSRDRACAEWLACESSQRTWDENTASWRSICEQVNLCNEFSAIGESGFCSHWVEEDPIVFDASKYSARDVSWYGLDYSGYAIPNQLPLEFYTQANVNPDRYCATDATGLHPQMTSVGAFVACATDADCTNSSFKTCTESTPDFRLAYVAGSCDEEDGQSCMVGFCQNSGESCNGNEECNNGENCIIGYCETTDVDASCGKDTDCISGFECKNSICVDTKTGSGDGRETCTTIADCTVSGTEGTVTECVTGALAKVGACYNSSCLIGVDGQPFVKDDAESQSCRGYPESSSPFPTKVVKEWMDPDKLVDGASDADLLSLEQVDHKEELDAVPYNYVNGFSGSSTCAPTMSGADGAVVSDDCTCSYLKANYGNGFFQRYYPTGTASEEMLSGICSGGDKPGASCVSNEDCGAAESGAMCYHITRQDRMIGWPGFCVERDSSIQLYGSTSEADRACLTWLPVDQLEGSTDIYAKYTGAGYPLQETFYCTEIGYYVDLYPTGARFDDEGSVTSIDYACAQTNNATGCDFGEYGDDSDENIGCQENVFCPKGYVAMLGYCDNGGGTTENTNAGTMCKSDGEDEKQIDGAQDSQDDCPFFCIPTGSRHMEGSDLGKSCDTDLKTTNYHTRSYNNTKMYEAGDLGYVPNFDGESDFKKFEDCVVRGIPLGDDSVYETDYVDGLFDGFSSGGYGYKHTDAEGSGEGDEEIYAFGIAHRAVGATIGGCTSYSISHGGGRGSPPPTFYKGGESCNTDTDCPGYNNGSMCETSPETDSGSMQEYLGCYQVTQVSTTSQTDGNKAWTNRTWDGNPNMFETFTSGDFSDGSKGYGYGSLDEPVEAGRALFGEYYQQDGDYWRLENFGDDSWPLPVGVCDSSSLTSGAVGLAASSPDDMAVCANKYFYPNKAQYIYDGTLTKSILPDDQAPYALAAPYEDLDRNPDEEDAILGSISADNFDDFGVSSNDNPVSITQLLTQLYAKIYGLWRYDWDASGGGYKKEELDAKISSFASYSDGEYDISNVGDTHGSGANLGEPTVPQIASVQECFGSECVEGDTGSFSVNEIDNGTVEGSGGNKHTSLKFFAWANSNQMPIRNVIVDWGDGKREGSYEGFAWPLDSQSGSIAKDNFFKNHRGLEKENESKCEAVDEWGLISATCETTYFSFEHDYQCSENKVKEMQNGNILCEYASDGSGRLVNSPCTGGDVANAADKCVFQPRIFVKDNWGWCTGFCNSNPDDATDGCYGSECNFTYCPSYKKSEKCSDIDGNITNPWVNFGGLILLDWKGD
ncbi:TPA: hypothetical protein DD617_01610 [Candidatus Uhrbacteria bacterium]|nr:hypothetical protein [Candidatus Uhrbacteria bacterium]